MLLAHQKQLEDGWTALHSAVAMGQADAAAWLLANGADVHAQKNDEWLDTTLHYAAANGNLRCVQILLDRGANPCARNFAGLRPSHYAQVNNHREAAAALSEAEAKHQALSLQDSVIGGAPAVSVELCACAHVCEFILLSFP